MQTFLSIIHNFYMRSRVLARAMARTYNNPLLSFIDTFEFRILMVLRAILNRGYSREDYDACI